MEKALQEGQFAFYYMLSLFIYTWMHMGSNYIKLEYSIGLAFVRRLESIPKNFPNCYLLESKGFNHLIWKINKFWFCIPIIPTLSILKSGFDYFI